ncbi:MAG: glycoside hydrolase family 99-like domain-containing protein [Acidimicrobiales bacterium]
MPAASGVTPSILGPAVLSRPATMAFYLPQFHPISVNDEAWGPGFTEWHNVVAARPRFTGHRQPVLPGQLGFYDLRLDETRQAQQSMALAHGIDGFCWYHYWFSGQRILHEPFDRMRRDPLETLPFMLCWANEAWTRQWSGNSGSVILEQRHSDTDDDNHIKFLLDVFADPSYVRLDDKPVFMVYQPMKLPDPGRTFDRWRSAADQSGFPGLCLLGVESFRRRIRDPGALGLDGVVEQQPDLALVRPPWRAVPRLVASRLGLAPRYPRLIRFPYETLVRRALDRMGSRQDPSRYSTVCTGWDNSPRRQRGAVVITDASPERYGDWLAQTLWETKAPMVFINAWNEWAEGAHLEPDVIHGAAYLEAHADAVHRVVARR